MSLASANRTGLRLVPEVTWGTTPASPTLTEVRYTGDGVNFDIESVTSDEIRSDRMTSDLVQVSQQTGGSLDVELSFGAFDTLLEAVMFSDYGTSGTPGPGYVAGTGTDISFTVTTDAINSVGGIFTNVVVGQWIKITGATDPANNGYFRVTTATDANNIACLGAGFVTEAAAATVIVTGQRLVNGVAAKFFSLEKTFNDTTATTYQYFTGLYVNGLSLSFETGSILSGAFDLLGRGATITEVRVSTPTDVAAPTNDVMNSVSNLNQIEFDNVATTASILSMTLDITNNLRQQNAIGSLNAAGIGAGRMDVTGSISLYFDTKAEYVKYLNNTSFSVSFRVQDGVGNAYVISMPNVEYESMSNNASGLDTDVILEGSYRALLGTVGGVPQQISIDRLPFSISDLAV